MFRPNLLLALLALTSALYAADPISEAREAVAAGRAATATELAIEKAVVARFAGAYRADVMKADATFGVQKGSWFTVVVAAAQDATLGQVGILIGDAKYACRIYTAEGGKPGFQDPTDPEKFGGLISPDTEGKPAKLTLTTATMEGLSSLEATLTPVK